MLKRLIIIAPFLIIFSSLTRAQESANPFELTDRVEKTSEVVPAKKVKRNNPFDLDLVTDYASTNYAKKENNSSDNISRLSATDQGTRIGLSLLLVLPLALLLTLFRGVFNDFLESAYRDRKFNQIFRRMNSMWVVPNLLLYLFFILSISVFTYLTLSFYGKDLFSNVASSIGFLMISISGFFLIKHSLLFFLGDTIDVKNESRRYSLLILTFNMILGVFLTPINLLLLLGPESIKGAIVIAGFLLCAGMLLLLLLRSLSVSNRLLIQHSLHFFMYLCTIEIAPLFIVAKLLS